MSGYDMKKSLEQKLPFLWNESFGQIYKELKNLTEEKLITKEHAEKKDVYSITESGNLALVEYLLDPNCKLQIRDEYMMKIFLGGNMSKDHNLQFLQKYKLDLEAILCFMKNNEKEKVEKKFIYPFLVHKLIKEIIQTKIKWAEFAMEYLK
jgi:DNA-binding PadR family transcriptional regulator